MKTFGVSGVLTIPTPSASLLRNMGKRGVILVGFGRPSSASDPGAFLYEIFSDPFSSPFARLRILMKPAARLVAWMAASKARGRYLKITDKPETMQVIGALTMRLAGRLAKEGVIVLAAMRYGKPRIENALTELHERGIDEVDIVPLFPHRTVSTFGTIDAAVKSACASPPLDTLRTRMIGGLYNDPNFIDAWRDSVSAALAQFDGGEKDGVHLLFSAHAIPLPHAKRHDEHYTDEVEESARLIRAALGMGHPMSVAYQSRAPFGRWTGPSLADELARIGQAGARHVVIVPISFLYDNIETWCDLDLVIIPNKSKFGLEKMARAVPPNESDKIVEAIAGKVLS